MKRKIEIAVALLLATTFGLPSCEDWTDVDNLSVEYENVEQQNPIPGISLRCANTARPIIRWFTHGTTTA